MTRFRCPSVSSISSSSRSSSLASIKGAEPEKTKPANPPTRMPSIAEVGNQPGPSTLKRKPTVHKTAKSRSDRNPLKRNATQKEAIRMAFNASQTRAKRDFCFVFVGNLSSSVEDQQLLEMFRPCGAIRHVEIRASMGVCVPTANLPRPFFGFGAPLEGTCYATVDFFNPAAARKAIGLDGQELLGRKIVVTFSAADLPETIENLRSLLPKPDIKNASYLAQARHQFKERAGQLMRLTIQKTEYVIDPCEPKRESLAAETEHGGGSAGGDGAKETAHQKQKRHTSTFPRTII